MQERVNRDADWVVVVAVVAVVAVVVVEEEAVYTRELITKEDPPNAHHATPAQPPVR